MKSKIASKKVSSIPFYVKFSADFKFDVEKKPRIDFLMVFDQNTFACFHFLLGRRHVAAAIQFENNT